MSKEEIIQLINNYWKFDNNQQHLSSWHEKQDLIEAIEKLPPTIIYLGENPIVAQNNLETQSNRPVSKSEEVRNMIDTNEWIDRAIRILEKMNDADLPLFTADYFDRIVSSLGFAKESHTVAKHHLWKEMFEEWTASIKQK